MKEKNSVLPKSHDTATSSLSCPILIVVIIVIVSIEFVPLTLPAIEVW